MDPVDNYRATAREVMARAREQGVDLEPVRQDFLFQKGRRCIDVWRKDSLPGTGPTDEPLGTLHYSMQGPISRVPGAPHQDGFTFQGSWSEAGTLDSVEQALELVKAWLLEEREPDELPPRHIRRGGMG